MRHLGANDLPEFVDCKDVACQKIGKALDGYADMKRPEKRVEGGQKCDILHPPNARCEEGNCPWKSPCKCKPGTPKKVKTIHGGIVESNICEGCQGEMPIRGGDNLHG